MNMQTHKPRIPDLARILICLLHAGNHLKQEKAHDRHAHDPQNLCLHLDHLNGPGTFVKSYYAA